MVLTLFVFKEELKLGLFDAEVDCLFAFEDEVVVIDEFVPEEAGDDVGLADSLSTMS